MSCPTNKPASPAGSTTIANCYKCVKGYAGANCESKTCTCLGGTPTVATGSSGTLCDIAGEDCSACDAGYGLSAPAAAGASQTCKHQCAAFTFGTGIVAGTTSPCYDGQVLQPSGDSVWTSRVGNCLPTIIQTYQTYDAAKLACAMESTCLGVREPEHQTRHCSDSHQSRGWCNNEGTKCNTNQGGSTRFKPAEPETPSTCNVDCAAGYGNQTDVAVTCESRLEGTKGRARWNLLGQRLVEGTPTCVPNICTCSNGTATVATGFGATLCDVAGEDCSACIDGYAISDTAAADGLQTCVANTCTCSNGTATIASGFAGTLCDVAGEDCSSCSDGYVISDTAAAAGSQTCVSKTSDGADRVKNNANTCTCTNGTATVATGSGATLCDIAGEDCSTCTDGYAISSTAAAAGLQTCVAKTSDDANTVKNNANGDKDGEASNAGEAPDADEATDAATKEKDSRFDMPIHVWLLVVSLGAVGCVLMIYGAFRLVEGCVCAKRPSVTRKESVDNNIEMTKNPMKLKVKVNKGIESPAPVWTSHRTEDGKVYFNNGARSTYTDHAKNPLDFYKKKPVKMNKGIKSSPVPVWTSHRTKDGKEYFNNGARSTYTDHVKGVAQAGLRRRSSLQPATVVEVKRVVKRT